MKESSMLVRFLIALVVATLATLASTDPVDAAGQKYAVLIGINDYAGSLADLQYCRNDVMELRDVLVAAGFPEEQVICMYDGAPQTDFVPSKQNIERQLQLWLRVASAEEDLFVVAFSGHGFLENQKSYLCPCDVNTDNLTSSCVAMEDIYDWMKVCRAGQKVMMIDACRNMAEFRNVRLKSNSKGLKGFDPQRSLPKGIRILSSCEEGQFSIEDRELQHGLFMYYVMEGLRGKADQECEGNHNGKVSLDELYSYAHQRTKVRAATVHSHAQMPWRMGEESGLCELGIAPGDIPASDRPTPAPTPQIVRDTPNAPSPGRPAASPPSAYMALNKQAEAYYREGDYTHAIAAFGAIIDDSSLSIDLRKKARRSRGAAYLARAKEGDIENAIIDHQAADLTGVQMSVRATTSSLKLGKEIRGTVKKGQVVLVTQSRGEWLWVNSVGGNDTVRGWIQKSALLEQKSITSSPLASNTPTRSNTTNRPAGNARSMNSYPQQQRSSQGGDAFTQRYMQRNGRPPSIWETPRWESPREIQRLRARGLVR